MSTKNERATALGLMNSAMAMGWVVGPLMGTYLIPEVGLAETILIAAIPEIISLILVLFLKNDKMFRGGVPV